MDIAKEDFYYYINSENKYKVLKEILAKKLDYLLRLKDKKKFLSKFKKLNKKWKSFVIRVNRYYGYKVLRKEGFSDYVNKKLGLNLK